jgi:hypothetical protein
MARACCENNQSLGVRDAEYIKLNILRESLHSDVRADNTVPKKRLSQIRKIWKRSALDGVLIGRSGPEVKELLFRANAAEGDHNAEVFLVKVLHP